MGGDIVAAFDVFDSVGQMNDFTKARFFTDFTEFESFVLRAKRDGRPIDYVTICSPNYLHRSHIEFALRAGADAICEKPLVLNPWEIEELQRLQDETGRKVHTILQLRLNPDNQRLKEAFTRGRIASLAISPTSPPEANGITRPGRAMSASRAAPDEHRRPLFRSTDLHFRFTDARMTCTTALSIALRQARVRDCVDPLVSVDQRPRPAGRAHATEKLNKATRRLIVERPDLRLSGDFTKLHMTQLRGNSRRPRLWPRRGAPRSRDRIANP